MKLTIRPATFAILMLVLAALSHGEERRMKVSFVDANKAGPDFAIQGEYEGTIGKAAKLGAQVIALVDGKFDAVLYEMGLPGAGWSGKTKVELKGQTKDGKTAFTGKNFTGTIADGVFRGKAEDNVAFEMKKVERKSPTLGAKPPEGAVVLFDGTNVDQWEVGHLEEKILLGVPAKTKSPFGSFTLHIEFRTPFMPVERGQDRGNSGVYLLDQYEVQVLDSFGLSGENNECGGIYQIAKPAVNMCLPPLSWQTYDIDFTAAKFEGDKKVAPAVAVIQHNGVKIHELKLPHATPGGGRMDEHPGPFFLQDHGHGDPVRYRNIWVVEKK
ncbi:MAG: DUF1080 domain-containing protein [Planctomycetaceae bacterium]